MLLTLWVENVPQEVAQNGDRVLEIKSFVVDVEAGFLRCVENVMNNIGQLTRADAFLGGSRLVLCYDGNCASKWNAKC